MSSSATPSSQLSASDTSLDTPAPTHKQRVFPVAQSVPWLCHVAMDLAVRSGYLGLTAIDQARPTQWAHDSEGTFTKLNPFNGLYLHVRDHVARGCSPDLLGDTLKHSTYYVELLQCTSIIDELGAAHSELSGRLCAQVHNATFSQEDARMIDQLCAWLEPPEGYVMSEEEAYQRQTDLMSWSERWEQTHPAERETDGESGSQISNEALSLGNLSIPRPVPTPPTTDTVPPNATIVGAEQDRRRPSELESRSRFMLRRAGADPAQSLSRDAASTLHSPLAVYTESNGSAQTKLRDLEEFKGVQDFYLM